jgi:hypothetical protein
MYTGVTRLFSPLGVVASACDTASTLEDSAGGSLGGSLSGPLDSFPDGLEEAGALRCGGICLDRRPRGPGGGGVARVANVRMH